MTADGTVFSATQAKVKNVYGLLVSYKGATEGDEIALREGGATGSVKVHGIIPTDNGMFYIPLGRYGREFTGDCYYTELATAAGKIFVTVIHT